MKKFLVCFSTEENKGKISSFCEVDNVIHYNFGPSLPGIRIYSCPDNLKKSDKEELCKSLERDGSSVIFVPTGIETEITEICNSANFLQKEDCISSINLKKEMEKKLKHLLALEIVPGTPDYNNKIINKIKFDKVIQYDLIKTHSEQDCTSTDEQKEKLRSTSQKLKLGVMAILILLVGLVVLGQQFLTLQSELRDSDEKWRKRLDIGISEIEIARGEPTPDVAKYVQMAIEEIATAEEYDKAQSCELTIVSGDNFNKLGVKDNEVKKRILSMQENFSAIAFIAGEKINFPKELAKRECE